MTRSFPLGRDVGLANGDVVAIQGKISLCLGFRGSWGSVEAALEFSVLEGLREEVILGILDIMKSYHLFFLEMLRTPQGVDHIEKIERITPEMFKDPWMTPSSLSEEELMMVEKPFFFNFLETSPEESFKIFRGMLREKVSGEFSSSAPVLEFLEEEGISVFCPVRWDGILMEPVDFCFSAGMPESMKPYRIRVPQGLTDAYEKEVARLCGYLYRPSDSPIASPVVVAKKATYPFIWICGDYRRVNKFCEVSNYRIPDVIAELHKLISFDVYTDLDVTNAFHQIPLGEKTSRVLSVQTPFGQFQPKFMPEGVAPASLVLMKTMFEIFKDYRDWLVVIHDNILVLGRGYDDLFWKTVKVIRRCKERNLYLKLAKSSFGVRSVNFFGYVCSGNSYRLSEERIDSVTSIPFPRDMKEMQRFLGSAMYFKPFIADYAGKTALLYDMIRKDFDWGQDLSRWESLFGSFKKDIIHSFSMYHPDHSLDWFLSVDASDLAVGGVLVQRDINGVQQVIAFVSRKLSKSARAWSTYEKEAYAMYYSVHQLRQYLYGKFFVLLTDHRNLVWIETSEVPKIIRIRLYLQTFDFKILHVPGKENVFSD